MLQHRSPRAQVRLPEDLAGADERLVGDLERLQTALSDREPHLRSARSWHLAARRR